MLKIVYLKNNSKVRASKQIYSIPTNNLKELANIVNGQITGYGVLLQENGLVVIDIDNDYTFEIFKKHFSYLLNTYIVKTKRGYHLYYKGIFNTTAIHQNEVSIDIKGSENSYVVGVGSIVDGYKYTIYNDKEPIEISEETLQTIVSWFRFLATSGLEKEEILNPKLEDFEDIYKKGYDEFVDGLYDEIKKIYREGNRQNIVLAVGGFLRKEGYSYETAKRFIEKLVNETNDKESRQRLDSLLYTYSIRKSKALEKLLGYSYLSQFENVKKYIDTNKINTREFIEDREKYVVYLRTKENDAFVLKPVLVGGILERVIERVGNNNERIFVFSGTMIGNEEEFTDIAKVKSKMFIKDTMLWNEYLIWVMKTKGIIKQANIGWVNGEWVSYGDEGYYWSKDDKMVVDFSERDFIEDIYEHFQNTNTTSKCIQLSFVNAVYGSNLVGNNIFFIQLEGFTGAGKTTLARMMTKLWDATDDVKTANITTTGVELLAKRLGNRLLVLDETTGVEKQHFTNLIYSLSTGLGKTRGRKDLTTETTKIQTNIVITGEIDLLTILQNLGLSRRVVKIVVEELDKPYEWYVEFSEEYGGVFQKIAGYVFKKYSIDEIKEEYYNWIEKFFSSYELDYAIKNIIYGSVILNLWLEDKVKEYGLDYNFKELLVKNIKQIITDYKEVRQENDPINKAISLLQGKILENDGWVLKTLEGVKFSNKEAIGIKQVNSLGEITKVGILTGKAKEFFEKNGIHKGIIKELIKKDILKRTSYNLTYDATSKKVDVYEVNLDIVLQPRDDIGDYFEDKEV